MTILISVLALGETINALIAAGMRPTALTGHDSVPCEAFLCQMTRDEAGERCLSDGFERLAASDILQT